MSTATAARAIPLTSPELAAVVREGELAAVLALLRGLDRDDWCRPTDCTGWTVHDVLAHLVGQYQDAARPNVFLRHYRAGRRHYPDRARLAALTQRQVDELGGYPAEQLIEMLATVGPRALRAASRVPGPLRRLDLPKRLFPEDPLPEPGFGYLLDVIAVRDTWMHRVDLALATGRPMVLGDHDREVVAQVVRNVGTAWTGPPVALELTGPAGGAWTLGSGPPTGTIRADAVGYLRTLSGRDDEPELDIHGDPDGVAGRLAATARVVF